MESTIPLIGMRVCLENEAPTPCNSTAKDAGRQPALRYAVLLRSEIADFAERLFKGRRRCRIGKPMPRIDRAAQVRGRVVGQPNLAIVILTCLGFSVQS